MSYEDGNFTRIDDEVDNEGEQDDFDDEGDWVPPEARDEYINEYCERISEYRETESQEVFLKLILGILRKKEDEIAKIEGRIKEKEMGGVKKGSMVEGELKSLRLYLEKVKNPLLYGLYDLVRRFLRVHGAEKLRGVLDACVEENLLSEEEMDFCFMKLLNDWASRDGLGTSSEKEGVSLGSEDEQYREFLTNEEEYEYYTKGSDEGDFDDRYEWERERKEKIKDRNIDKDIIERGARAVGVGELYTLYNSISSVSVKYNAGLVVPLGAFVRIFKERGGILLSDKDGKKVMESRFFRMFYGQLTERVRVYDGYEERIPFRHWGVERINVSDNKHSYVAYLDRMRAKGIISLEEQETILRILIEKGKMEKAKLAEALKRGALTEEMQKSGIKERVYSLDDCEILEKLITELNRLLENN